VQIVGKRSEEICADLEPGDECYVEGDLVYKSAGKTSDGKKAGGLVLSSWTLTKAMSTATEVSPN
jgi:hypothetical protein